MGGTTEEIKQAIVEHLQAIYPRGRTEGGISFKNKTGADGRPLIGFGDAAKVTEALNELIKEDTIISYGDDVNGQRVFHYKTDAQTPVVGHLEEIKLAITEYLCRIYPQEAMRIRIEVEGFKDEYRNKLLTANGLSLAGAIDGSEIQKALDDLVVEGKIDAREKERDGVQSLHYMAKSDNSITPNTF